MINLSNRSNPQDANNFAKAGPLPDWEGLLQCIKIAHRACSNLIFVGWDAAFTPNGPVLLEGNANWSASEYQCLSGEPLGHTKFAQILQEHLPKARPWSQSLGPRIAYLETHHPTP